MEERTLIAAQLRQRQANAAHKVMLHIVKCRRRAEQDEKEGEDDFGALVGFVPQPQALAAHVSVGE